MTKPFTHADMEAFGKKYGRATKFLWVAASDYAAARCLLLNLLFPGLTLGAQAIEKYLKAYLVFDDPKWFERTHALVDLAANVQSRYPNLALSGHLQTIGKFDAHYKTRYPDAPGASQSMTTADLHELDPLIVMLNEKLPCPRNVCMNTEFYFQVGFLTEQGQESHVGMWIKKLNRALAPLVDRIISERIEAIKEMHPNWTPVQSRYSISE